MVDIDERQKTPNLDVPPTQTSIHGNVYLTPTLMNPEFPHIEMVRPLEARLAAGLAAPALGRDDRFAEVRVDAAKGLVHTPCRLAAAVFARCLGLRMRIEEGREISVGGVVGIIFKVYRSPLGVARFFVSQN